jgi:hypothetical protein
MQSVDLYGIRGSCFSIRVEYTPDFIIWHLASVDKYTKSFILELKELLSDWSEFFRAIADKPIFVAAPRGDKIHKLIKRLGFEYLGEQYGVLVYQHVGEI